MIVAADFRTPPLSGVLRFLSALEVDPAGLTAARNAWTSAAEDIERPSRMFASEMTFAGLKVAAKAVAGPARTARLRTAAARTRGPARNAVRLCALIQDPRPAVGSRYRPRLKSAPPGPMRGRPVQGYYRRAPGDRCSTSSARSGWGSGGAAASSAKAVRQARAGLDRMSGWAYFPQHGRLPRIQPRARRLRPRRGPPLETPALHAGGGADGGLRDARAAAAPGTRHARRHGAAARERRRAGARTRPRLHRDGARGLRAPSRC